MKSDSSGVISNYGGYEKVAQFLSVNIGKVIWTLTNKTNRNPASAFIVMRKDICLVIEKPFLLQMLGYKNKIPDFHNTETCFDCNRQHHSLLCEKNANILLTYHN